MLNYRRALLQSYASPARSVVLQPYLARRHADLWLYDVPVPTRCVPVPAYVDRWRTLWWEMRAPQGRTLQEYARRFGYGEGVTRWTVAQRRPY